MHNKLTSSKSATVFSQLQQFRVDHLIRFLKNLNQILCLVSVCCREKRVSSTRFTLTASSTLKKNIKMKSSISQKPRLF